jgi:hypothetical protein
MALNTDLNPDFINVLAQGFILIWLCSLSDFVNYHLTGSSFLPIMYRILLPLPKTANGARPGGYGYGGRAPAQVAQFLTPEPVMKERRQDRPITLAFEGCRPARFQKRPGLAITQGRRFTFVRVGFRAFDSAHRVVSDRIGFAQMIKERSDRGACDGWSSEPDRGIRGLCARRSGGRG